MGLSICGIDCGACEGRDSCGGCVQTNGRPFGGDCIVAKCCQNQGFSVCDQCTDHPCSLRATLIAEFNALGIVDMAQVTSLNMLPGSYINLTYTLPSGQVIRFWDDQKIYLGNQICKPGDERCYGLTADADHLLVCEYGQDGADAEVIVFKKREKGPTKKENE